MFDLWLMLHGKSQTHLDLAAALEWFESLLGRFSEVEGKWIVAACVGAMATNVHV